MIFKLKRTIKRLDLSKRQIGDVVSHVVASTLSRVDPVIVPDHRDTVFRENSVHLKHINTDFLGCYEPLKHHSCRGMIYQSVCERPKRLLSPHTQTTPMALNFDTTGFVQVWYGERHCIDDTKSREPGDKDNTGCHFEVRATLRGQQISGEDAEIERDKIDCLPSGGSTELIPSHTLLIPATIKPAPAHVNIDTPVWGWNSLGKSSHAAPTVLLLIPVTISIVSLRCI